MRRNKSNIFFISSFILLLFCNNQVLGDWTDEVQWCNNFLGVTSSDYHIVGDFNGDENTDIAWLRGSYWYIRFSQGDSFSNPQNASFRIDETGQTIGYGVFAGDFNGDGVSDKLTIRGDGLHVSICDRMNHINENWILEQNYSFHPEENWSSYTGNPNKNLNATGDVNGDGLDDFVYLNSSNLKIYVLLANYNSSTSAYSFLPPQEWMGTFFKANTLKKIILGNFVSENSGDLGRKDLLLFWDNSSDFVLKLHYSEDINGTGRFNYNHTTWETIYKNINGTNIVLVGDYNGDGEDDFSYNVFEAKLNRWRVIPASSTGDGLDISSDYVWADGAAINLGAWSGDFDGDGFCDQTTHNSNGWWVGLTRNNTKIVGAFLYPWWLEIYWNDDNVDTNKSPAAGWSDRSIPEYLAPYSMQNDTVVKRQVRAMNEAGINLVIIDISNGWATMDPLIQPGSYAGCGTCINAVPEIIQAVNEVGGMKFAFMVGLEFQGRDRFDAKGWTFSWEEQWQRIVDVLDIDKVAYYDDQDSYFKYLGKPLLLVYLSKGYDYPPRYDDNGIETHTIPRWDSLLTKYTVRYSNGVYGTFDNQDNDNIPPYREGAETKRFWQWGSGWNDSINPNQGLYAQIPIDYECMTVMPGQRFANEPADSEWISVNRRFGDRYRESWVQVLETDPNFVLITDWNNWSEETAIEKCYNCGADWEDTYGNDTPDYYLQLTEAYSYLYKNGSLKTGTYVKEESDDDLFYYDGSSLVYQGSYPDTTAHIVVPDGTLILSKQAMNINEQAAYKLALYNYPNPFNPSTNISFSIPKAGNVRLEIYDILGGLVTTLVNQKLGKGEHNFNWSPNNISSGMYISVLRYESNTITKKLSFIK